MVGRAYNIFVPPSYFELFYCSCVVLDMLTKNTSQCWWLVYSELDFDGWGPSPGMQIITKVRAARPCVTPRWIFKSSLTWSTWLICNHQNSCCSSCFKAFYQWILLISIMTNSLYLGKLLNCSNMKITYEHLKNTNPHYWLIQSGMWWSLSTGILKIAANSHMKSGWRTTD